jgi:hypothetical protein
MKPYEDIPKDHDIELNPDGTWAICTDNVLKLTNCFKNQCHEERPRKPKHDLYCGDCDSTFILEGARKRQEELKKSRIDHWDKEEYDRIYGQGAYQKEIEENER